MSIAAVSIQSAPREQAALAKLGHFQLRKLADALGKLQSEEEKMAFHGLTTPEAKASEVAKYLEEWDRTHGGPPAVATPVTPVAPEAVVATVPAAAIAAATAATNGTAARSRRSPRTSAEAAPAAAPEVETAGTAGIGHVLAALTEVTNKLGGLQSDIVTAHKKTLTVVEDAAEANTLRLQELEKRVLEIGRLQQWTLTAFLTFMQESMNASMLDILGAAVTDAENLPGLIKQATGKK